MMKINHAPRPMFAVYQNPKDFPGLFVARAWIGKSPTDNLIACSSLIELREILQFKGFTRMGRAKLDDPVILEVWL